MFALNCICRILIFYDKVEMSFDMQVSMPHFKGHKKGRIYLTTHRVSSFYFIGLSTLTSRTVGFVIQFMYICIEMSR